MAVAAGRNDLCGGRRATSRPPRPRLPLLQRASGSVGGHDDGRGECRGRGGSPRLPVFLRRQTRALRRLRADRRFIAFKPTATRAKCGAMRQDLVYALAFDSRGRADRGHRKSRISCTASIPIIRSRGCAPRVHADHRAWSRLPMERSSQSPGNIGKLFSVGPVTEASGTYESDVLDAGAFTYWGRASGPDARQARGGVEFRDAQRQSGSSAAELESLAEAERRADRIAAGAIPGIQGDADRRGRTRPKWKSRTR